MKQYTATREDIVQELLRLGHYDCPYQARKAIGQVIDALGLVISKNSYTQIRGLATFTRKNKEGYSHFTKSHFNTVKVTAKVCRTLHEQK